MALYLTGDKALLVQIMAWCRQASNHYLSQCCSSYCHHMVSLVHTELLHVRWAFVQITPVYTIFMNIAHSSCFVVLCRDLLQFNVTHISQSYFTGNQQWSNPEKYRWITHIYYHKNNTTEHSQATAYATFYLSFCLSPSYTHGRIYVSYTHATTEALWSFFRWGLVTHMCVNELSYRALRYMGYQMNIYSVISVIG